MVVQVDAGVLDLDEVEEACPRNAHHDIEEDIVIESVQKLEPACASAAPANAHAHRRDFISMKTTAAAISGFIPHKIEQQMALDRARWDTLEFGAPFLKNSDLVAQFSKYLETQLSRCSCPSIPPELW